MKERINQLYTWVDGRLGLGEWLALVEHKQVPQHKHSVWYYWGGLSLFFFLVQAFTGVLLLIYYRPGPEAYESVRQITFEHHFGWLIRSAHSWAANLMVVAIFVHMFSVFFMKAYKRPREFGWWSGIVLLMLTMTFGFSGYLLPMDELAYFATKVGLEIPANTPIVGPKMAELVRGGLEVNEFTVQRFFALHVVVLPALFIPLLGFHLWLVQRHGNAVPPSEEAKPAAQRRSIPFFPNFLMGDLAVWLIALNVLALLSSMFPWELGVPADPLKPAPAGIHPEWYFMSSFQVLKALGTILPGVTRDSVLQLAGHWGIKVTERPVAVEEVIDGCRSGRLREMFATGTPGGRRARNATYFGLLTLVLLVITTIWGYAAL